MHHALFESLTGGFLDGTPLMAVPPQQRMIQSITDHLSRLFNTRCGSISHLPDYGLPDIAELYCRMPDGIEELMSAIRRSVERFEPRLRNVRVAPWEENTRNSRLFFVLSADLIDGVRVRFHTAFTTTGSSSVAPWRKPQQDRSR